MTTAMGSYRLNRLPLRQNESLQAWDAADEYLLNTIALNTTADEGLSTAGADGRPVLVVNDQFGALAIAFHERDISSWGDSLVAHQGTMANFKRNGFDTVPQCIPSTEPLSGVFGLVLIKVPKTLALLEHQLAGLAGHIDADSVVMAAGMVKAIHTSTLDLFEKYLGPTKTSLATKKARVILPQLDTVIAATSPDSPYPSHYLWEPPGLESGIELCNHANVFAREQLDIGARAMLAVVDQLPASRHIIDLGCGNGVLGIAAKISQPQAKLSFVDESYMALASARINWPLALEKAHLESTAEPTIEPAIAEFITNDCLSDLKPAELDLVICNPPFHQGQAIGDHIAWRMFKQSYDCLQPGGQLWVVGNKHLQYNAKLKRLFGNCQEKYSNNKFVVYAATKQAQPPA
jgi:16S rRNA G1207 methylase RsmC